MQQGAEPKINCPNWRGWVLVWIWSPGLSLVHLSSVGESNLSLLCGMEATYLQGIKNAFFSPLREVRRRTKILSPYRYRTVIGGRGFCQVQALSWAWYSWFLTAWGFLGKTIEISRKGTLLLNSVKHSEKTLHDIRWCLTLSCRTGLLFPKHLHLPQARQSPCLQWRKVKLTEDRRLVH